jgi:predicted DsbA family dithiol-disulfide isomerase
VQQAGVDAADVEAWLQSNDADDIIDQEVEKSKEVTSSVPTLVIQGLQPECIPDIMDLIELFVQIKESEP